MVSRVPPGSEGLADGRPPLGPSLEGESRRMRMEGKFLLGLKIYPHGKVIPFGSVGRNRFSSLGVPV